MKILMLTTNSSLMDGINRHILAISTALNNNGVEIGVVIIKKKGDLHEALSQNGVKVWSLGYSNGHKLGIYRRFKRIVKEFQPDVVHSHVMSVIERIVLAKCFKHVPLIHTVHGISDSQIVANSDQSRFNPSIHAKNNSLNNQQHKTIKQRVEDWLYKRYNPKWVGSIFVSKGVRDAILPVRYQNDKHPVIYNPINFNISYTKDKRVLKSQLGLKENDLVIGTACRISDVKQPELFTEVICQVLSTNVHVHGVIMGDGEGNLIDKCKHIVEKFGVGDRFHWLGRRSDSPAIIAEMDCFILTSKSEGMPTAVLESFVSETLVAMFKGQGGLKDIESLNADFGPFAIISDDTADIVDKINLLLRDFDMRKQMTIKAKEIAFRHFSTEVVVEQLKKMYERCRNKN